MRLEERAQHHVPPGRNRNFGLAAAIGRLRAVCAQVSAKDVPDVTREVSVIPAS